MSSPEFQLMQIHRVAETIIPTKFGRFRAIAYRLDNGNEHMAYIPSDKFRIDEGDPIRVHTECLAGDVFGSNLCDCAKRLHESMEYISKRGLGAVIYVRDDVGRGVSLVTSTLCIEANVRGIRIAASIANNLTNHL